MGKTYDQAPAEVTERVVALIRKYHPDLEKVQLRVDLLMASTDSDGGHAVTLGGYPCLAVVKIVGSKERAKGTGDAEIVIDRDAYEAMTSEQRDALLDHELYHLNIVLGKDGQPKRDEHQRPKLKMRKHDIQVGWFVEVARRHKQHSHEVRQATEIYEESGQVLFGFVMDGGKAADLAVGFNEMSNPAKQFVDTVRKSGASVTISSGNSSVMIDKEGVHSDSGAEPTAEQIDEATKLAFGNGFLTRSAIQRALRVGYNHACRIVDQLVALGRIGTEDANGRFAVVPAA